MSELIPVTSTPIQERPRSRRNHRRPSLFRTLPEKLIAKRFNVVQFIAVMTVAYFAYRVIVYFAEYSAPLSQD